MVKTLLPVSQSAPGTGMPPQVGATPPPTRADRLVTNLLEPAATPRGTPQASVYAEVMGTIHPQRAPRNGVNMFAHIEIRLTLTASTTSRSQPWSTSAKGAVR